MDFEDASMGEIPTHPMRVKILYTFDPDNKTNCLARFPDVLNIPAVAIDESSQVGVIDLKQCIQAVVAASPELISRLSDGDFTIYAYDYSEYDTPLVGQGMLSNALIAATPNQQQNKKMITGRVCKNMLALFSSGVKETLEVKLRLVPVPKPAQTEFLKGMENFRSMSPAVSAGFDPNAWSASMAQNKSQQQQQMTDYFDFSNVTTGSDRDMALVDDIFGLGSTSSGSGHSGQLTAAGVGMVGTPTDLSLGFNPAFPHSAPSSRAASPIIALESSTRHDRLRHQSFSGPMQNFADHSRPASRASVRSEVNSSRHQRQESTPSAQPMQNVQQQAEVYYNEDGQARKRAKVTQTDWRGRSSFGSKSSDLRVNAATTASMQMHRPIAKRPVAPGSNLEPPPRVPTPVPQMNPMLPQQQQNLQPTARRSLLRQASTADSDFMSDADNFSDAIISSPEDSPENSITADGTPQEIPSSPPVFPGINQPQPSSPGLPTLPPPRLADSGYMSERGSTSSNVMEGLGNDNEDRSPDAQDYEVAAQYRQREQQSQPVVKIEGNAFPATRPPTYPSDAPPGEMNIKMVMPGDMNQLPQKLLLNLPPQRRQGSQGPKASKSSAPERAPTIKDVMMYHQTQSQAPTPSEAPCSRRGSLALPPMPSIQSADLSNPAGIQRPDLQKRQSLQRTRTASNESEAGSPAPSDTEGGRLYGSQRSGSGAQRRKIIEQRLQRSIAKGEMPQYCSHCGAIETPTWRRIYVKECEGKLSPLDYVEGEGETIGIQITETDDITGEATKFVIRKSMKKTKECKPGEGFKDVMVCNPCGLWFNKFKNMRPSDKWGRKSGTRKSKKQKTVEPGMSTDGLGPQSDAFFTDQGTAEDPADDGDCDGEGQMEDSGGDAGVPNELNGMPAPSRRPRSNSLQAEQSRRGDGEDEWNASQLDAALTRAVQSSPARYNGSQQSPIEIEDLTPRPTRRLLFPSPRRHGEVKSLDDNGQVSLKSMPPTAGKASSPKPGIEMTFEHTDTNIFEAFTFDKENMAPPLDNDDLAHLFEGSPTALFKTPRKTPAKNTTTPRSMRQLNHLLKTPTPASSSRKRRPLTPNANAANNANLNDFMTSPSSPRYFLRSTPSRIERNNTPSRSLNRSDNDVSPWSRHLAQMLSETNDGSSNPFTSPSRAFDFSELPAFTTPLGDCDWEGLEGMLSSEFATFGEDGGAI